MFVSTKIHMLKLNPQCDGIGGTLRDDEVTRVEPRERISALTGGTPESLLSLPLCVDTERTWSPKNQSKKPADPVSVPRHQIHQRPGLGLPAWELWEAGCL